MEKELSVKTVAQRPVRMSGSFPAINEILPHRGPMLMVDEVLSMDGHGGGEVRAVLKPGRPYSEGSALKTYWLAEIAAQSVAALFHLHQNTGEKPPSIGYLIAIDVFNIQNERKIQLGDELRIRVRLDYDIFPIGQYETELYCGDDLLASGRMKFVIDKKRVVPLEQHL